MFQATPACAAIGTRMAMFRCEASVTAGTAKASTKAAMEKTSCFMMSCLAHEALRPKHQHTEEQHQHDGRLVLRPEQQATHDLDHADQDAGPEGARHAAKAAQVDHHEGQQDEVGADVREDRK